MKTKGEILEILRMMKPELEVVYNVKAIGIFGSVVREESHSVSDIDVLVEFQRPIGMFKFLELEELLSERLGCKVDLVSKKALKPAIGRAILAEVVLT
ncbi:MAG: nucleotidyltransferase family protein [Deltaproteobacteria bacterium]|nr:nucleotidyltransferase family protein [Deltaproteobacteria bacterium]